MRKALLKQTYLSSEEYQIVKKLKQFKAENYQWDKTMLLYVKIK